MDEAERGGIKVDAQRLSAMLGIPVLPPDRVFARIPLESSSESRLRSF